MQLIQLDGVYSFMDNIKNLKLDDNVKLIINKNNRLNADAIGVYYENKKIGYIPYKLSQINIKNTYKIHKINLNKNNLQIIISCNNDDSNYIDYEPDYIIKLKYDNYIIKSNLDEDLKHFSKYLQRSDIIFTNLGITYNDENYINLLIKDTNDNNLFYTVTKKYYDTNIFKYDEFFINKLISTQIYELFKIHRLDIYLKKNYKSVEKKIKSKNIRQKIIEDLDIVIKKTFLEDKIFYNIDNIDIIKILILKELNSSKVNNINIYSKYTDSINKDNFKKIFNNLNEGYLFYNHKLMTYAEIEFTNNNSIFEISNDIINNGLILKLLVKLIIANKNNINIFNPINNCMIEINITNENKQKILELL
jgi:hypothetical protein